MTDVKMTDEERYMAALHGIQSGVKFLIARDGENAAHASPKHLRTGVNSAMIETAAIWRFLMDIGLITEKEILKRLADEAEGERERYEQKIDPSGKVKLG